MQGKLFLKLSTGGKEGKSELNDQKGKRQGKGSRCPPQLGRCWQLMVAGGGVWPLVLQWVILISLLSNFSKIKDDFRCKLKDNILEYKRKTP